MTIPRVTKEEALAGLRKQVNYFRNQPKSENRGRLGELHSIVRQLRKMGYECEMRGNEILHVIEENHIDVSTLKFPQGDYDSFKKAVDDGRYAFNDYDVSEMEITDEERQAIEDGIAAGQIFRIR